MKTPTGYFKQRLAEINEARGLPPGTRHNGEGFQTAIVRPRMAQQPAPNHDRPR